MRCHASLCYAHRHPFYCHVWRARIILKSDEGLGSSSIMAETGKSKTCVWRWLERFMHEGVNGLLRDRSRPPGKAPIPPERVAEIVRLTQQAPPHEANPKTLHLESRPRSNHRRTKQRVPHVGINPLAFTNTLESRRKAGTRSGRRGAVTVRIEPRSVSRWAASDRPVVGGLHPWRPDQPADPRVAHRAVVYGQHYADGLLVEVPASPPVRTSELLRTSMKCASLSTCHTSPSPQSMPATHTDHETIMNAKYCTARGTDVPEF